jgi:ABC-2 type transport system ATP-binding protein
MIRIINLNISFDKHQVLDIEKYNFNTGKVHGIIGLNGAGKTTFFNAVCKFLKRDAQAVLINNKPFERHDAAYLETTNYFYETITAAEYLSLFPSDNLLFNKNNLIELLQLKSGGLIDTFSTGMRKKLALLAIICQEKPVYILDEPFNGLDLESNKILEMLIQKLAESGKTIFLSSHILSPLTTSCAEIHLLRNGNFEKHFQPEQFNEIENELFSNLTEKVNSILKK